MEDNGYPDGRSNGHRTLIQAEDIKSAVKKIHRPSYKTEYENMAAKAGKYLMFAVAGWTLFTIALITLIINFASGV